MTTSPERIRAALLDLVAQRGPNKTICPSEVARALSAEHWRTLMPAVRKIGCELVFEGRIVATQKGQVVDPKTARGPIRYRL
ncbi:DUF3253 domain-containing protein [Nodosilinea sp. LEGE 07298]|uniref:DUF3253 domain-containing protein n=1 Tax=Nodosilinea sp. LEGE 07298 TaxID=2777970 RepID=UPI0018815B3F|nr:DUF3253 domain-containing protein [Nodosilinea sp. LEGE 07298]MBE9112441.1 DUF3253 domain-containing protein [Nodosilinea sp. LEGE 07298]